MRVMLWDNDAVRRGVVMLVGFIVGGLVISSCSGSSGGIHISSATLDSYRTPPGKGILCAGSGEYDFLTFTITNGVVSGHIVETNVSTRAELPMNGFSKGHTVTFLPLDGFGEFKATLNGHSLDFSTVSGIGPTEPVQCSLVSLAKWRTAAASATHFTSRQLSTPEFLALTDLIYAMSNAHGGLGPFATPASTLTQNLSAQEGRALRGNAPSGYTVGDHVPDPRLIFTSGPVTRPHDVSVDVSSSGYVVTFATRAADGSCWYNVTGAGYSSTAPGVIESSCSADNLVRRLVKYNGP
jgi:hypothetical protein